MINLSDDEIDQAIDAAEAVAVIFREARLMHGQVLAVLFSLIEEQIDLYAKEARISRGAAAATILAILVHGLQEGASDGATLQ